MSTQEKPEHGAKEESLRKLKAAAHALEPVAWVGKAGITPSVVEEIKKQLKKKSLIKVKLLRSAIGDERKKDFAKRLAEETGSSLVSQVGMVAVLHKEGEKGQKHMRDAGEARHKLFK